MLWLMGKRGAEVLARAVDRRERDCQLFAGRSVQLPYCRGNWQRSNLCLLGSCSVVLLFSILDAVSVRKTP